MKCRAKIAALLLCVAVVGGTQETHDTWVDPSTGLMWAGKDNGRDVTCKKAVKYCSDLRLAGNSDWRLASLGELEGIYDKGANAPRTYGAFRQKNRRHVACKRQSVLDRRSMEQHTEK
ncbi:MAG TPA: DUF1566 domain-containing protein [Candidatus Angelobacter sp.]|nr:DUF1566 domain-containing protein [Candidatus Angelobacter sp.]